MPKQYSAHFEMWIDDQCYRLIPGGDNCSLLLHKKDAAGQTVKKYKISNFDHCNCPTSPEYRNPHCKHVKGAHFLFRMLQKVFDQFPVQESIP